jgi:hypothetical protein
MEHYSRRKRAQRLPNGVGRRFIALTASNASKQEIGGPLWMSAHELCFRNLAQVNHLNGFDYEKAPQVRISLQKVHVIARGSISRLHVEKFRPAIGRLSGRESIAEWLRFLFPGKRSHMDMK